MMNAPRRDRFPRMAAGIFGLVGVGVGAMGAHALKAALIERGMLQAWETASRYHLFHSVALLGIAALMRASPDTPGNGQLTWAARLWCVGMILFSGSLYWLALGGPRWLGPVTPIGGVALMGGWLLLMVAAFAKRA